MGAVCFYQIFLKEITTIFKEQLINDQITAKEVRLIGADGEQLGVMPIEKARQIADNEGLDLVLMSGNSNPAVCKIMDKNSDEYTQEIFQELERLIRSGFIRISYLKRDTSAFELTSRIISMKPKDERDSVSAMDALIVASSATDPECEIIYTEDNGIAFNCCCRRLTTGAHREAIRRSRS